MKKKIITLILTAGMIALVGCSSKTEPAATNSSPDSQANEEATEAPKASEEAVDSSSEAEAKLPKAGIYAYEYEEELEGTTYTYKNYIIVNGDGTATFIAQDTVPATYDDKTFKFGEADANPYELKGDSILLDEGFGPNDFALISTEVPADVDAWFDEQIQIVANNQRVEPLPASVDPSAPADGEYWISLKSFEECEDSYGLICDLCLVEQYDTAAIKALKAGDVVVIDNEEMTVDTVTTSGTLIIINGGIEEGGAEFRFDDSKPTCQYSSMDDFPTFKNYGEANLFVPADCVINDTSDIVDHPDGIVMTPAEFKKAMTDPQDYWYWNTSIVVKNNEVAEINIRYVP